MKFFATNISVISAIHFTASASSWEWFDPSFGRAFEAIFPSSSSSELIPKSAVS
ncbi:MAG: hypothetical protein ABFD07_14315 [Methanobacterium sp.]